VASDVAAAEFSGIAAAPLGMKRESGPARQLCIWSLNET
jgi:hypothetical protein